MRAAVVTGDRREKKGLGRARGALLASVLVAVGIMLPPGNASAQIIPISQGSGDYCADWSPRKIFGPTPHGLYTVSFVGSGTVSATMWGTGAQECILRPVSRTLSSNGQFEVQGVCEFHCAHDHIAPYPWPVQFTASATAGMPFVGWTASCEPNKDAPRSDCLLRWSQLQPNVSLTANFAPTPDVTPPAPAPSLNATPESYAVSLNWGPSSDSWLAGYDIVRNGTRVARVRPGTTSFRDTNRVLCQTSYTYRVEAYDWSGNEARSLDVTTTTGACQAGGSTSGPRPNTVIHVKPPKVTRKRAAFFHFGSGAVRATKYRCKLDRRAWRKCSGKNGVTYRRLKPGRHVFRVRAGNANGWDPTPAKYRWRIRR